MELEEIRAFFQASYAHIHKLDEEIYDCKVLQSFCDELLERFRFIADNFSLDGTLKSDFSGRVLFFYQNGSDFCRPFILSCAKTIYKEGKSFIDVGFFRIDIEAEYEKYQDLWAGFGDSVKSACGKSIEEFFNR